MINFSFHNFEQALLSILRIVSIIKADDEFKFLKTNLSFSITSGLVID